MCFIFCNIEGTMSACRYAPGRQPYCTCLITSIFTLYSWQRPIKPERSLTMSKSTIQAPTCVKSLWRQLSLLWCNLPTWQLSVSNTITLSVWPKGQNNLNKKKCQLVLHYIIACVLPPFLQNYFTISYGNLLAFMLRAVIFWKNATRARSRPKACINSGETEEV